MDKVFEKRLERIQDLADRLEQRKSDLIEAAGADAGFPVRITGFEVELAVDHLRTMDEEISWIEGGKPYGKVGAIFPYDAPTVMLGRLGGSALLSGNGVKFSFSSWTPRTARIIAEVASHEPSLEPVIGMNNRDFGAACVADEDIRVLFISGGSAVGDAYRSQHRAFDKLFFAGPGGMPAALVLPDADPRAAADFIVRRAFINGGQYCTTIKKAYIHSDLYDEVRHGIVDGATRLKVGKPDRDETDIGPITVDRTRALIERAIGELNGMRRLAGGVEGIWVHPFIFEAEGRQIPDLELFGPLLVLQTYDDPEQAAADLMKSRYGFLLTYFGRPSDQMKSQFEQHFGMIYDNPDFEFTPLRLPFGGKKESGWILEEKDGSWVERDGAFLYSRELVKFPNS